MIVTKMAEERQYYIARERLEVLQKSVGISVIKITIQHKIKMAEEIYWTAMIQQLQTNLDVAVF